MRPFEKIKKDFETCGMLLIGKTEVDYLIKRIERLEKRLELDISQTKE